MDNMYTTVLLLSFVFSFVLSFVLSFGLFFVLSFIIHFASEKAKSDVQRLVCNVYGFIWFLFSYLFLCLHLLEVACDVVGHFTNA